MYVAALLIFVPFASAHAEDYFSWLDVRYEGGLKKSFLAGPYRDKGSCERLVRVTWDNIQPVCGNCKKEMEFCGTYDSLNQPLRDVLDGKPTALTYVMGTKKNRIIVSGADAATVLAECENTANNFRMNGFPDARCIHN